MRICAYMNFKGNAREAMAFYSGIFKAKPDFMTYGEMPPSTDCPVNEATKNLILHGEITIAKEQSIMIGDDMRPGEGVMGNAVSLALMLDEEAEQHRIFGALAEGGTVLMPLSETFWSAAFGSLTDRFGVTWHLNLCKEPPAKTGS